jgi:hypothetical protein
MGSESGGKNMTINYSDGRAAEVVLLARTESTLLVALKGGDDVMEISEIDGTWVSPDCEPVTIESAWQRINRQPKISEADCYCSHELAARLVRLLFADSSEDKIELRAPACPQSAFGNGAFAAI